MNVITPFDFVAMMPEDRRVAIVGNAPSLKDSKLGGWIDSHDVVVRFNECAVIGFEADVGIRTDILVSNPYMEGRARPLLDGQTAPKVVLILNPQTRRGDKATFGDWVKDCPVLFSYTPDLKGIARSRKDISLTTGTYAIPLLARILRPRHLSIAGFTMFLPGASHHYWTSGNPDGLRAHSPFREAEIFIDLVNDLGGSVEVTSDIAWVADIVSIPLRRGISTREMDGWTRQAPVVSSG